MMLGLGLGLGTSKENGLRRLLSFYWTDHNGNNITDHNGNKIVFRKRRT